MPAWAGMAGALGSGVASLRASVLRSPMNAGLSGRFPRWSSAVRVKPGGRPGASASVAGSAAAAVGIGAAAANSGAMMPTVSAGTAARTRGRWNCCDSITAKPANTSNAPLHKTESPSAVAHRRPSPRFEAAACDVMANEGSMPRKPPRRNPGNSREIPARQKDPFTNRIPALTIANKRDFIFRFACCSISN